MSIKIEALETPEYGWYIYESYIEDGCYDYGSEKRTAQAVEVFGPSGISDEDLRALKNGAGDEFELYDDDYILYYKGRITGKYAGFEPVDDYGTPNAGAVHVKMDGDFI